MKINRFSLTRDAAGALISSMLEVMNKDHERTFNIALSGGSTPALLFNIWVMDYRMLTPWNRIHFYWVDERCVPADHPESNYKVAWMSLLEPVRMDETNIHRILGENDPESEALRYEEMVRDSLPLERGIPIFDFVLLGVGDDGHTSSVFPGQEELLHTDRIYVVSKHPQNGRERVALTGVPMMKARKTIFFVTGKTKNEIVWKLEQGNENFPAGYIAAHARDAELYTDCAIPVAG
jgi:6-phosphogluconolactonase